MKSCIKCNATEEDSLFGRGNICKVCKAIYNKQYYAKNIDKLLVYNREKDKRYYKENKEKILAKHKIYRDSNPEREAIRSKKYYESHKEEINLAGRLWYKDNKDRAAEVGKKYREKNKEKLMEKAIKNRDKANAYAKQYREDNKEKIRKALKKWLGNNKEHIKAYRSTDEFKLMLRGYGSKARYLKANSSDGTIPLHIRSPLPKDLLDLLEYQEYKCNDCGVDISKHKHLDHHVPLSKGGTHSLDNVVWLCPTCNMSKNAKMPDTLMLI